MSGISPILYAKTRRLSKEGEGAAEMGYKKSCTVAYTAFPLIRFALLSTFSRLGEGFYSCALCKKPGCLIQPSITVTSDFPTQPTLPWHADAIGAGVRSTTQGKSRKRTKESLLSSRRFRLSPATGPQSTVPPSCFHSTDFYATYRFFVTFFTEESNVPPRPLSRPSSPFSPGFDGARFFCYTI